MIEKVGNLLRELGRKKNRVVDRVSVRLAGAMCESDIRSLDFVEILHGP
jgi:hypothetical protein